MLTAASSICLVAMFLLLAGQGAYVLLYWRQLRATSVLQTGDLTSESKPVGRVAVILCVRGNDPSLEECLQALDVQNWPDYQIQVGLDSSDDPAYELVQSFAASASHEVSVHLLKQIPQNGSLKCAVLAEIVEQLDERFDAIALVDADSIVQPDWLETLVKPLSGKSVGAVTGTRWFEPPGGNQVPFGTQVRAIWNAAAIVQMHLYKIPWGGSLALKMQTVRDLKLLSRWRTMLCEDTGLKEIFLSAGLRIVHPPSLVVVNREVSSVGEVCNWLVRQLMTVRLYHRHWFWVAVHGLTVGSVTAASAVLLVLSLVLGQWNTAIALCLGFALYNGLGWLLLDRLCQINHRWIPGTGEGPVRAANRRNWLGWMLAIPVTQLVHLWATLQAIFASRIEWRNVVYRCSKDNVEIVKYLPYSRCPTQDDSIH